MMLFGLELALLACGTLALVRGEFAVPRFGVISGLRARLLGFIAITPLPLSFLAGMALAAAGGAALAAGPLGILLELCVLASCGSIIYDAVRRFAKPLEAPVAASVPAPLPTPEFVTQLYRRLRVGSVSPRR